MDWNNLPIAIAPGGGGASAALDYESLVLALSSLSLNYPINHAYYSYIFAKILRIAVNKTSTDNISAN